MVSGNLPGDSRAYQIQIPCILFLILAPFFVAVRIWARVKVRSGLGWDDWTILASLVCAMTVSALMLASCEYGFGQHITNLSKPNKLMTLKLFYVAQAFYKLTINLTKSSILLLYLRIFVKRYLRIACYTLLAIILTYMVATFASSVWQCTPIPRAWDKSIPGTCISITSNWYANAGFSIATDVLILALPMYPIYASQLPRSQKAALMIVFALGFFVTVTSILRMQTLSFSSTSPDTTYDIASSVWTMIEENVAIICACLPVCRLPLAYLFPTQFSSTGSSSSKKSVGCDSSQNSNGTATHNRGSFISCPPKAWTANHRQSLNQNQIQNQQLERDVVEISPARAAGWEDDDDDDDGEHGRQYILSRVVTTTTTTSPRGRRSNDDDCDLEKGQPRQQRNKRNSGVIHMTKHYSVSYDTKPSEHASPH
ncbi:integral membrane protein [Diplogelasinospora grovesii]|uniref:Integral membrane protein n=1 Tax=Diplogelasinospora grovesii TaxID=303347 RepID=A0AAN6N2D9_9PEZI|nr:integral membrane protein [Diplogelasinospora grovesii]